MQWYLARLYLSGCAGAEHIPVSSCAQGHKPRECCDLLGAEIQLPETMLCSCSQPVLEYSCPRCGAIYNTLQAAALIDFRDGQFHCEHCASVLVTAEAADGVGDASARRERLKAMKELQVRTSPEPSLPSCDCLQGALTDSAPGAFMW